jgi:hypothetical protein
MINRIDLLRREMTKAVQVLKPNQSFNVVFFYDGPKTWSVGEKLLPATDDNKRAAYKSMEGLAVTGQTNPLPALRLATSMRPEAIYFVTDGGFNNLVKDEQLVAEVDKLNKGRRVRINTILFCAHDNQSEETLRKIADAHGGFYRYVSEQEVMAGINLRAPPPAAPKKPNSPG